MSIKFSKTHISRGGTDSKPGRKMNVYLIAGIVLVAASLSGFAYVTVSVLSYTVQVFRATVLMLLPETAISLLCGIFGGYTIGISRRLREAEHPGSSAS
jgi:hypothetical protein